MSPDFENNNWFEVQFEPTSQAIAANVGWRSDLFGKKLKREKKGGIIASSSGHCEGGYSYSLTIITSLTKETLESLLPEAFEGIDTQYSIKNL